MLIFYAVLAVVIIVGCIVLAKLKLTVNLTVLTASIVVALLAPWGVYAATAAIAKNKEQTYYEFWNGSEQAVSTNVIACERDGYCDNTYQCDPYTVYVTETYTDSKGNIQSRTVAKTEYHDCPYSTQETDYIISTTLGDFYAGDSWMTGPQFRAGKAIPGGQKVSPPQTWLEAQSRIGSGNPSGVTQINSYKNFILAADTTLFENYSDRVESLLAEGLIPTPASATHSLYMSEKAYNAGNTGVDIGSMNRQLTQLNGYVGSELRGDMHVLFVESDRAGVPTDYTNAVKAHWTSEAVGKHAIAKNTLTLVVGVREEEGVPVVDWAKGFTGMPVGNEGLMQEFSNLKDEPINDTFIGSPTFDPATGSYTLSGGLVETMISGEHKFERVSMSASDADDTGTGFTYLSDSWKMKPETLSIAIWISSILAAIILGVGTMFARAMKDDFTDPLEKAVLAFQK